ncbi:MAG TPA: serine/threonine-protein kinase [Polyangiales bacterium]|nr:serine/threonine-protein kinase [Polyangiales bacterium]
MASLETSIPVDVGAQFGPYELVRRLGVGGTAETFEAIRRGPGGFTQRVCLKVALPFYRDDETFMRLFEREARLAAKLRHRNIVGVIDFGEFGGRSYIALELIDGIDLRTLLDTHEGNRLDAELVVLIGLDLAAALVHAHSPPPGSGFEGLIHRDISPSNILISRQGEVMLSDFGVAKDTAELRRKSSEAKGKFPYMSPEQLRAEPVDGRSDLFAVGVVLFEALAGIRPYEGPNDPATIMQILNGDHAELAEWAPDAPAKLCEVVERLIDPDPEKRLQNAADLIEELAELAPSPRVHKRLGTLVEERMHADRTSAREISSTVGKDAPAATTPSDPVPTDRTGASEPPPAPTKTSGRRRAPLVMLGLLVAGAAAMLLWRSSPPTDTVTEVATPVESEAGTEAAPAPTSATAADPVPAADAAPEADPATAPRPPRQKAVPPKPAHLDVIVIPWGDVWINGKRWGPAPMMNETLKPGRYRISAGQGGPSQTRTIRLKPGERKTLDFDLTK